MSPGKGRFITPDRLTGTPSNPGSWNRYAYASGDPIGRTDPGGTQDCNVEAPDCYCQIYGQLGSPNGYDPNCDPNYCPYGICGTGGPGQQPGSGCGASGSVGNPLTQAQTALIGGQSTWSSLAPSQQLVFYVITTEAANLGLDLSEFYVTSITVANGFGTQTELTLSPYAGSNAYNDLTMSAAFTANFANGGLDFFHGGILANWRQTTPTNSMQIVEQPSGNIQIDIDPNNPSFLSFSPGGVLSGLNHIGRHLGNVLGNTFTGRDTNYANVANGLGIGVSTCP